MITNVNGAQLSELLLELITSFQQDNCATCDEMLDYLNEQTDQYIDYNVATCSNHFLDLRTVRDLHALITQIKKSAIQANEKGGTNEA